MSRHIEMIYCDRVLQSLVDKVSQMSRHYEKCCDIIFDAHLNLCRENEKSMSR